MDEPEDIQDDELDEEPPDKPLEVTIKKTKPEATPYDSTDADEYQTLRDADKKIIKEDLDIDG